MFFGLVHVFRKLPATPAKSRALDSKFRALYAVGFRSLKIKQMLDLNACWVQALFLVQGQNSGLEKRANPHAVCPRVRSESGRLSFFCGFIRRLLLF
jgi:hypothetical protein